MASRCVLCGYEGKLTLEHVFPNWLHTVGLSTQATPLLAGPLNRLGRELSPPTPYSTQVRAVCRACNEGWMKQLEDLAADLLTPWIRGEPAIVPKGAAPSIARWLQKTALVSLLVSLLVSVAGGVGVPVTEYHQLYARRAEGTPLPASHAWIGRYDGTNRSPFLWVTPLAVVIEGLAEPDWPQGYAMTLVLGNLLLFGVRLTTQLLDLDLRAPLGLSPVWPRLGKEVAPAVVSVGKQALQDLAGGKLVEVLEPLVQLQPWKPATELEPSQLVDSMVELPILCGKHVIYYPAVLAIEGSARHRVVFTSICGCGSAYLIETARDGVRCTGAGTPDEIMQRYASLPGDEYSLADEHGTFFYRAAS